MRLKLLAMAVAASAFALSGVAQAKNWYPVKILNFDSGKPVVQEYSPLKKAVKPWKICVLFPHMKDTFWVAVDYGVVQQAREEGVDMTLYQAGGYTNLPKQLSQFDDCMASNYDAIVIGAISEAGVSHKVRQAVKQGMTVISTVNPVAKAPFTSKFFVDFTKMGNQTGHFLVNYLDGKKANVVAFPGPSGSGWAEQFVNGFKEAIKPAKNVDLLGTKFGDSGVAIQLSLIQNALQAYPKMNVIWGCAPAAEAAIGAIRQAGRPKTLILSAYENQAMLDAMNKGDILGFATQYPVLEGRVAIDTAVRVLEHKPYFKYGQPIPDMISKKNVADINMNLVLAPTSFKAVYSVQSK